MRNHRAGFELEGLQSGTTQVTLSSVGLPDRTVVVAVVSDEVTIESNSIVIGRCYPAAEGRIVLAATGAVKFTSVSVPASAAPYVDINGEGTDELMIEISTGVPLGVEIELPVLYDMNGNSDVAISVLDLYHHGEDDSVNNYFVHKPKNVERAVQGGVG